MIVVTSRNSLDLVVFVINFKLSNVSITTYFGASCKSLVGKFSFFRRNDHRAEFFARYTEKFCIGCDTEQRRFKKFLVAISNNAFFSFHNFKKYNNSITQDHKKYKHSL